MKNKLVIFTSSIGMMGGAQMYVENKAKYFQTKGWEVYVFYNIYDDRIYLNGLEKFRDNFIPEFKYPIQFVPNCQKKSVVERIKGLVKPEGSNVVIESQLVGLTFWAEFVAKHFNARHVINVIEEQFPDFSDKENAFFEFKLLNGDILNATANRLRKMFKDRFKKEYDSYIHNVSIPCTNVVSSDVENNYVFDDCDYTILSIGRLDKPYIPTMNVEIKKFASLVGKKNINVIYVGGSHDGSMEETIPNFFNGVNNLRYYVLGYVFPIPQSLIKSVDVAISCANSVLVSFNEGVPTIVVDVNDYSAIGVYGITTKNLFKRENEKLETISGLLMQVLVDKAFEGRIAEGGGIIEQDKAFEEEMTFFLRARGDTYYDINHIYPFLNRIISKTKYVVRRVWGRLHVT